MPKSQQSWVRTQQTSVTVGSERRQIMQCWINLEKENYKNPPVKPFGTQTDNIFEKFLLIENLKSKQLFFKKLNIRILATRLNADPAWKNWPKSVRNAYPAPPPWVSPPLWGRWPWAGVAQGRSRARRLQETACARETKYSHTHTYRMIIGFIQNIKRFHKLWYSLYRYMACVWEKRSVL